jgi:hypothetical protein
MTTEPIPVTDKPFDIPGAVPSHFEGDEIVPGPDPQHAPEQPPIEGESETGLVDPPVPPAQDQSPIAVVETECGFYVYLVNGHWLADGDLTKTVHKVRDASFDDFRHAASTIIADLQAHATAQATIQLQMQQQVMAQQAQNAAEIAKRTGVGGGVDLSGLAAKARAQRP